MGQPFRLRGNPNINVLLMLIHVIFFPKTAFWRLRIVVMPTDVLSSYRIRFLRTLLVWFVLMFHWTLLIAKNMSWHLFWGNFHTFRYLRPVCKWLKVVYVWVVLLVQHYKRQEANKLANVKQLPLLYQTRSCCNLTLTYRYFHVFQS